jgi:glycerophosphoryl diester phosphodiesterase
MSLVISHRGANRYAPENTLAAFEKALSFGVKGFETDVHMTCDGRVVVCHDSTVDRTSNGTGLICEHTLAQLRSMDFGAWFSPAFAGTQISTLEEWLALCGGLQLINVELKRGPGDSSDIVKEVIVLARRAGLRDKLMLSSFDQEMLDAGRAADPTIPTGLLFDPVSPLCEEVMDDPVAYAKAHNLVALHPFVGIVTKELIDDCHSAGILVNTWVANQEHNITAMRDWGCDGIMTDVPDLAMQLVAGA